MELPAHNNQTALLDSAVPGQSQKETIVSALQTSAVSACPIAQHSTDVPSGFTMDAVEVKAENLHANVHLDLQKAGEADKKLHHILMETKCLLHEVYQKKRNVLIVADRFEELVTYQIVLPYPCLVKQRSHI